MDINEIDTYDELKNYLLERMDFADDNISRMNPSFTREQIWNMYLGDCIKWTGKPLPIKTKSLFIKHIKRDFNQFVQ